MELFIILMIVCLCLGQEDEKIKEEDEEYIDEEEVYDNSITLVMGSPCSGKSTYVRENSKPGDLIWDFDKVHTAISSTDTHQHIETI